MAGKYDIGEATNSKPDTIASRAFSEGMYHRAQGTAVAYPTTDNPHEEPPVASLIQEDRWRAWDNGWTVADDAAGTTIDPTDAPGVAVPQNTILV